MLGFELDDLCMNELLFLELSADLALGFADFGWNLVLTNYFLVDLSCYCLH